MEDQEVIHEKMLNNIDDSFDKTEGSFFYDATKPVAIALSEQDVKIESVKDELILENLSGEELEKRINDISGLNRKVATYASDPVTITGVPGTSVMKDTLVASETVNFIIDETKVIDETGSVSVIVICESPETIGNVPVDVIKYFPVTIAGLTAVTNEDAFTNGYKAESDEDLLIRHYEKIRTPATSGNKYHYKNWAKEIPGVGDAKVFSLWNGNNTVKILIINQDRLPADISLVNEVQDYIDPGITGLGDGTAPIGAFCTIESAIGKVINVSFTGVTDNTVTTEVMNESIENNLDEYFKSIALGSLSVSYAIIGAEILKASGILDYSNLLINSGTNNISLTEFEVPVLGLVTINE